MDFLDAEIYNWSSMESYRFSKLIIESLSVTNDSSERAVKLTSDFLNSSRKEVNFQRTLQVVEYQRKSKSNIRKMTRRSEECIIFLITFFLQTIKISLLF